MRRFWLALSALAAISCPVLAEPAGERWFRISAQGGAVIGWQREAVVAEGANRRETSERQLAYSVDGHAPVRQYLKRETLRDGSGAVLSRVLMAGPDPRHVRRVDPLGQTDETPLAQIIAIAEGTPAPHWTMASRDESGGVVVERTRDGGFDGAWRVERASDDALRAIVQPQLGASLVFEPSALPLTDRDIPAGASIPHAMLASPFDITRAARMGHMRYVINRPAAGLPLPETGEQRVTLQADSLTLDICATCGPGLAEAPADLTRWTRPSRWIESDAPELVKAARAVAVSSADGDTRMRRLSAIARRRLPDVEYEGLYSARAAWKRRRGDCTEDALVLAALARAAGIPAMVASGLVYERERYHGTRDAFLPHAWTIAYVDGRWRSYDISVGGFDATHIALAVGDGDPATITAGWKRAALIDWRAMAEVRSASRPR